MYILLILAVESLVVDGNEGAEGIELATFRRTNLDYAHSHQWIAEMGVLLMINMHWRW
jgi:hypothetical protein